jgi:hypothetical protein
MLMIHIVNILEPPRGHMKISVIGVKKYVADEAGDKYHTNLVSDNKWVAPIIILHG